MSIEDTVFPAWDEEAYPHARTISSPYTKSDMAETVDKYREQLPPEIADEAAAYLQSLEDTRS